MPTCRDCGSEKVGWDKTKAGYPYLRDFGQPHNKTCPAKNGQTAAKKNEDKEQPASPFSADITDAEQKSLEAAIAKARPSGAVKGDNA